MLGLILSNTLVLLTALGIAQAQTIRVAEIRGDWETWQAGKPKSQVSMSQELTSGAYVAFRGTKDGLLRLLDSSGTFVQEWPCETRDVCGGIHQVPNPNHPTEKSILSQVFERIWIELFGKHQVYSNAIIGADSRTYPLLDGIIGTADGDASLCYIFDKRPNGDYDVEFYSWEDKTQPIRAKLEWRGCDKTRFGPKVPRGVWEMQVQNPDSGKESVWVLAVDRAQAEMKQANYRRLSAEISNVKDRFGQPAELDGRVRRQFLVAFLCYLKENDIAQ